MQSTQSPFDRLERCMVQARQRRQGSSHGGCSVVGRLGRGVIRLRVHSINARSAVLCSALLLLLLLLLLPLLLRGGIFCLPLRAQRCARRTRV
jgi:hypothetical protein